MRIVVTGARGQLGQEVVKALAARQHVVYGVDREDFDLLDSSAVHRAVQEYRPDAIIHCAAYTAVDKAESEPEKCAAINAMGTLNVVRAALAAGAKLLYVSTDYVFSGAGDRPWETEDKTYARNVYGLSKAQGEEAVRCLMTRSFIVRTGGLFGMGGQNFVRTIIRLGQEKQRIRCVTDQVGSLTYAPDLAQLLVSIIQTERYGIYHATNEGYRSYADFADAILQATGSHCRVQGVTMAEYGAAAQRPLNCRLSLRSLDEGGFHRPSSWEDALGRYLAELREAGEL